MKTNRLYFIDTIRAFAILMMLQGHFIDGLLNASYKSETYLAFNIWNYFRGNTAPIFFTISGLIVMLLFLKAHGTEKENYRIQKGLKRGGTLILLGYALRIPYFQWLGGQFNTYFLVTDVLQIIGLSLLLLNGSFYLFKSKLKILPYFFLGIGTLIFLTEPLYRTLELPKIPLAIANYFSKANGSVFTIFPWFGYICYGAFIAHLFHKYQFKERFKTTAISVLTITGLFLMFISSPLLSAISQVTHIDLLEAVSTFNYLYVRLGNVLLTFALFYALETQLKHPLISKIGRNTLSIYVVHFIILYGSFTGIGLYKFYHNGLLPVQAVFGALLFIIAVTVIVLNEDKIKASFVTLTKKALVGLRLNLLKQILLNRR
ncbi:heparan-alpha-glucosaminide N-acetyltransferase domain-containing protein [Formosa sp. A9]|uniref:heparan-alpha-glucosaminide N-acetyltransferase domain-containing protein n=1 Tax=Formosa sp. A9 TaxID=3442641 RepID=UPI003EB8A948